MATSQNGPLSHLGRQLPSALDEVPALDNTLGAWLIGTFLSLGLYGLLLHQVYAYFNLYPNDRLFFKGHVLTVLTVQTFSVLLNIHTCFFFLVSNYFDPTRLNSGVWSIYLTPIVTTVSVVLVQAFYARRSVVRHQYRFIAAASVILFLAELGFDTTTTIKCFALQTFSHLSNISWLVTGVNVIITATDFLLSTTLIYALYQNRTGFSRTDTILQQIALYTINTGLLVSATNVVVIVLSLEYPSNLIYGPVTMVAAKLYANTLLGTLNSRRSLARRGLYTFGGDSKDPITATEIFSSRSQGVSVRTWDTTAPCTIELEQWSRVRFETTTLSSRDELRTTAVDGADSGDPRRATSQVQHGQWTRGL